MVYRTKLPLGGLKDSPFSPHPMKQEFNVFSVRKKTILVCFVFLKRNTVPLKHEIVFSLKCFSSF